MGAGILESLAQKVQGIFFSCGCTRKTRGARLSPRPRCPRSQSSHILQPARSIGFACSITFTLFQNREFSAFVHFQNCVFFSQSFFKLIVLQAARAFSKQPAPTCHIKIAKNFIKKYGRVTIYKDKSYPQFKLKKN